MNIYNDMEKEYLISDLVVVGCAEVPAINPVLPRLLSPIFAIPNSKIVLFPPFVSNDETIFDPLISIQSEFDDLLKGNEITALKTIEKGKSNYGLWIDDQGDIRYEPLKVINLSMKKIYFKRMQLAEQAFSDGYYESATIHASIAYAAAPEEIEPLVVCAASELKLEKYEEKELTDVLAREITSFDVFQQQVEAKLVGVDNFWASFKPKRSRKSAIGSKQLVIEVQKALGNEISNSAAEEVIRIVLNSIIMGIKRDKSVQLIGFGTFEIRKRAARKAINPATRQIVKLKAEKTIAFKPSASLRSFL